MTRRGAVITVAVGLLVGLIAAIGWAMAAGFGGRGADRGGYGPMSGPGEWEAAPLRLAATPQA